MKLNEVNSDDLAGQLSGMYLHYCFHTQSTPEGISVSQEAQLRRFLDKHYFDVIKKLPEELRCAFAPDAPEGALLSLLQELYQQMICQAEQRKTEFETLTQSLGAEARSALLELAEDFDMTMIRCREGQVRFLLEDEAAYRKWLCLQDAQSSLEDQDAVYVSLRELDRLRDQEGYRMVLMIAVEG